MVWTAPEAHRIDTPELADERASLDSFLQYHRQTLLWKCSGLTAEQLKRHATAPSNLTLLGLIRHMTDVERGWFRRTASGQDIGYVHCTEENPDADFNDLESADAAADFAAYLAEIQACSEAVAELGLDARFRAGRDGTELSLRWLYLHMLEEYARHNGHADLLREAIDGATGE